MALWLQRAFMVGLAAVLPAGLSGCAQYSVAGQFEDTGELFFGAAVVSLADAGTLEVATLDGRVTCKGATRVSTRAALSSNAGVQGSASSPPAKRAGIERVVLPERNRKDVEEVESELLSGLALEYVGTIDEALEHTLAPAH